MRTGGATTLILLALALAIPGRAFAQESEESSSDAAMPAAAEASTYSNPDRGWDDHRFQAGGFVGNISGGTALGLVENVFFRSQFNMGTDGGFGLRGAWVFAPRFDVELEFGKASPGLMATLTDLRGQGKTEVPFADLDMTWFTGSLNYSMIERTRRIVPYLTVGIGVVTVSSNDENIVKSRQPGLVFGGGVRIRIVEQLALRADARGLRSGFGTKQKENDLPGVFVGDFNASSFLWTVGVDVRF